MKPRTVFLSVILCVCTTLSWAQSWDLSETMKAVFADGVLTISTTANAEAMPDFENPMFGPVPAPPWVQVYNDINSLVIVNNVTSIGSFSFGLCRSLTSVTIPNSVTTIGESAFNFCSGLTSLTMPNVTEIGGTAFSGCTGLTSVTMPNVTEIERFAFEGCTGLTSVTMPNVTKIGLRAFINCNGLTFVTMPNVVVIDWYAFERCTALTNITIPKSVTSISSRAFMDCTGLKNVSVAWETPLRLFDDYEIFSGVNTSELTLHVPPGTKSLYEEAEVWKDFGTVQETGVIPEVTKPVGENGRGVFSLCLYIPSNAKLTGSFEIQFPDGFTLDEQLSVLSVEFGGGGATLSFTSKGNNTWLIEIKPSDLKSANVTEYRKIMDIAYKANVNVTVGSYEVKIMNLDFTTNDSISIKEELMSVNIPVNQQPTSIEPVHNKSFIACFTGNMLSIESPYTETVAVYSVMGAQLYTAIKNPGIINIPFPLQSGTIVVIQGSKSGTVKILKQH